MQTVRIEDCQSCFILLDPAPVAFDDEVARLRLLLDNRTIPRPAVMGRLRNEADTADLIGCLWYPVLPDPRGNDGPESLWWRTQCAMAETFERLSFKVSTERPNPKTQYESGR